MMKLGLRERITIALGVGLAFVLVFGAGSYAAIESLLADSEAERASQEAVLLVETTVAQLRSAEALQRKYILTEAPEDLKAYQASVLHVQLSLDRLRTASALLDDREAVESLRQAILQRLTKMEESVRVRQEQGIEAATARVASNAGSGLRERIDALIEPLKTQEARSVELSRAESRRGALVSERLIVAGGALTVLLLGWSIFLVNRYAARRDRAESQLAESIAKLERMSGALRASEAQLREVLDVVPVMFGYVDRTQRVLFHNQAYAESIGRTKEEIHGKSLREVLGTRLYEAVRHHIDEAFAGYTVTYERSQRRMDGALRDYEVKYFPRYGEGAEEGQVVGVYAMGSDITDFKRIDRMKSEFVSTVSHELRTPLTSIRGSLGLISAGVAGPLPDKAKQLVGVARDNCERLVRLVDDILDIEKLESGQMTIAPARHELQPLLARVVADNEAFALQHGVTLSLEAPGQPLCAEVDRDRFVQVVTNLVSNGVRFSPRGEPVRVRLCATADETLRIEVIDRGPGVPADFSNRIFQKFAQADASSTRKKSGSGLGLNISKAFVERMGGRIAYRRDGDETVFFIDFAAAPAESTVAEARAS